MTATADGARWGQCLRQGARTVLRMTCTMRDVVTTVRLVSAGRPAIERMERERDVLRQLREGFTVSEIAACSCVAECTVRTQVRSILAKLGVTSQVAAVGAAHGAGGDPSPAVATTR